MDTYREINRAAAAQCGGALAGNAARQVGRVPSDLAAIEKRLSDVLSNLTRTRDALIGSSPESNDPGGPSVDSLTAQLDRIGALVSVIEDRAGTIAQLLV
jgi:hypothetical protein